MEVTLARFIDKSSSWKNWSPEDEAHHLPPSLSGPTREDDHLSTPQWPAGAEGLEEGTEPSIASLAVEAAEERAATLEKPMCKGRDVASFDVDRINSALNALATIGGFLGAALVDTCSRDVLSTLTLDGRIDIELAAKSNIAVVVAKQRVAETLGQEEGIEEMFMSLEHQYHLIRPLKDQPRLFIYVALDRRTSNLAMARLSISRVEEKLQL